MYRDLADAVEQIRIHDTHEHLWREDVWLATKPDVLCELFGNYVEADLRVAGASAKETAELLDANNPDIAARFAPVQRAWEAVQFTGYGEATRYVGRRFFDLDTFTPRALAAAQERLPAHWPAGERLSILRDQGTYDHVQVDGFTWDCPPDASGPDFFLYDLSWRAVTCGFTDRDGSPMLELLEPRNLAELRQKLASVFQRHAPTAIAIKTQHAYSRPLNWQQRSEADVSAAFQETRRDPAAVRFEQRLCLSDWCLARGVELAIEHNLPVKIHTGYQAGMSYMTPDWLHPNLLAPLIKRYPAARFVLMHMSWPYQDELIALAKHFANVWVDLCWAWQMSPRQTMRFVSDFLHSAPSNKLLGFGGDTARARSSVAYSMQARKWLTRALSAEIDAGELTEPQAIALARQFLADNQRQVFDLNTKRRAVAAQLARNG